MARLTKEFAQNAAQVSLWLSTRIDSIAENVPTPNSGNNKSLHDETD